MKKRFGKYHDFIVLWTMFWTAISVGLILGYLLNQIMCSSGAHYLDWEDIEELKEKDRILKEQKEGTDPKYICNYSGLPSLLIYQEDEINR